MLGSREAGERGDGCWCTGFDGGGVVEVDVCCGGCLTAVLLMMLSGATGDGSIIWDVWCMSRARIGRRGVGDSRLTGVRSSNTERRSDLLMIVVVRSATSLSLRAASSSV